MLLFVLVLKLVSCVLPSPEIFEHLPRGNQMVVRSCSDCENCVAQSLCFAPFAQNFLLFNTVLCHHI